MAKPSADTTQLPLSLPVKPASGRDDLIESPSNRLAVSLIDDWPDWPGQIVVLTGPAGAGKSHIAGVWASAAGAATLPMAILGTGGLAGEADNLLIEDAAAGAIAEEALFHAINRVRARHGHLLITSRDQPAAWRLTLPDLISRVQSAPVIELHPPDDGLLSAVIVKLFADRQVTIRPEIVGYLLKRMERSLSAASLLVDWLDKAALARGRRIDRRLAGEALAALGMV